MILPMVNETLQSSAVLAVPSVSKARCPSTGWPGQSY